MIKYITFKNSAELEAWQEGTERQISSISPIPMNMDISMEENAIKNSKDKDIQGNIGANFGVFVVYLED
jgi:hypothetical protein